MILRIMGFDKMYDETPPTYRVIVEVSNIDKLTGDDHSFVFDALLTEEETLGDYRSVIEKHAASVLEGNTPHRMIGDVWQVGEDEDIDVEVDVNLPKQALSA